jgi:hypothetical protein
MDAYRVLQDALNTMRYTLSLKRLNQELYEHLCGSIAYIINYSEKITSLYLIKRASCIYVKGVMRYTILYTD